MRKLGRNGRVALVLAVVVVAMTGMAYASVPLYRIFCEVTGFDGTTQQAQRAPSKVLDETISVRFDTNVRDAPLRFRAEQVSQTLRIGQTGMAFFEVANTSDRPVTVTAVYNVVPESAGAYFQKLQCFCFDAQTLKAGEQASFPMIYFIDPEIVSDRETRGVDEITLSYTFFPAVQTASGARTLGGERRAGL